MTKQEIQEILELSDEDLQTEEFRKAFRAGFLQAKYLVNQSTVKLAQSGSSPAQTIANKLITNIDEKEVLNG